MSAVFKKLNLKEQRAILIVGAPEAFAPEIAALTGVVIQRDIDSIPKVDFSLAFVTRQRDLEAAAKAIAPKAEGDATIWFAYPKASSKNYKCDFNRDTGWAVLGELGFEAVRQVAIDEDWSALRFRRVEFIKSMSREEKRAMTEQGKERVATK